MDIFSSIFLFSSSISKEFTISINFDSYKTVVTTGFEFDFGTSLSFHQNCSDTSFNFLSKEAMPTDNFE